MTEEEPPYLHQGKPLADLDLWALGLLLDSLKAQELKRDDAREKLKARKIKLPPPNPEFVKLKNEVELAIRKKQENV